VLEVHSHQFITIHRKDEPKELRTAACPRIGLTLNAFCKKIRAVEFMEAEKLWKCTPNKECLPALPGIFHVAKNLESLMKLVWIASKL
jgi:hypothetical protein